MSDKIKVVHFVSRLEFGGAEAMLLNYTEHMKHKEDFDYHIITQDINDPDCIKVFEENGYNVHIVTHKRKSIMMNVKEIYQIMKKEKFDIIHSHMTLTNFYVLFLGKMLGVKTRISHAHSALKINSSLKKAMLPILRLLNRRYANVWMACGYEAGKLLYGKKALKENKVIILHNAIDLKKFQKNEKIRSDIRKKYGIQEELCVGHVGRFMKVKNHQFVIHIFNEILKMVPNSKLLLVGDGELRAEIQNEVEKLELQNNVIFTGNVRNTNELYQAMDVFILPSFFEGLPVVSVEAQARELPCIISDKVDKNCKLTPFVAFMSIEKSPRDWAIEIVKINGEKFESQELSRLTEAGYNIDIEAKKLENFYKRSINTNEENL